MSIRGFSIAGLALGALAGCQHSEPSAAAGTAQHFLIYGDDDRVEAFGFVGLSSMLALLPRRAQTASGDAGAAPSFAELHGSCEDERYSDQPALAECTGVLIAPDLVLTAAHCFDTVESCRDFSYVRGYHLDAAGELPALEDLSTFECDEVISMMNTTFLDERDLDFAVIRLTESVPGAMPLPLRSQLPQWGEAVTTVGTSGGLPMKASGGVILAVRSRGDYFDLSGDLYAGGSGSGVFDEAGALLGIHVRGGVDFEITPEGCKRSRVVPENGESGTEQANTVSSVLDELCRLHPELDPCAERAESASEVADEEGADSDAGPAGDGNPRSSPPAAGVAPAEPPSRLSPEPGDSIVPAADAVVTRPPPDATDGNVEASGDGGVDGCAMPATSLGGSALPMHALLGLMLAGAWARRLRRSA